MKVLHTILYYHDLVSLSDVTYGDMCFTYLGIISISDGSVLQILVEIKFNILHRIKIMVIKKEADHDDFKSIKNE